MEVRKVRQEAQAQDPFGHELNVMFFFYVSVRLWIIQVEISLGRPSQSLVYQ